MSAEPIRCTMYVEARDGEPLAPGAPVRWVVEFDGEVIVRQSKDPEHDACRALLVRGITGRVTFVHRRTGMAGLSMSIERGAGQTTRESTRDGRPRTVKWKPFRSDVLPSASESAPAGVPVPSVTLCAS